MCLRFERSLGVMALCSCNISRSKGYWMFGVLLVGCSVDGKLICYLLCWFASSLAVVSRYSGNAEVRSFL